MKSIDELLMVVHQKEASDLHLKAGIPPAIRVDGELMIMDEAVVSADEMKEYAASVMTDRQISIFSEKNEIDFAYSGDGVGRYRVNIFRQRGTISIAMRQVVSKIPSFEDLHLPAILQRLSLEPRGMILVTGATGSGKSTTLATMVDYINKSVRRHIVTVEDPIEILHDDHKSIINQREVGIDTRSYSTALRYVLRQDPDVILVGEIRDQETARMAMQAATTGHLVLTTIHARDTVGTIFRLLDLGVEPFLISNAVTMCISQRLVRVLCPNCKRAFKPDARMIRQMRMEGRPIDVLYDAVGCKRCMNAGYRGRMALFETLSFNAQLRDVILTRPTITDIRNAAGEWMFETLGECGFRLVVEGKTTFEEVNRVSGMD